MNCHSLASDVDDDVCVGTYRKGPQTLNCSYIVSLKPVFMFCVYSPLFVSPFHPFCCMLPFHLESNPGVGRDFPLPSRPALGPTHLPIQWVPGLFAGSKAAGAWRWPPTPSSADVKERIELYLYSPSGLSWPVVEWTSLWTLELTLLKYVNRTHYISKLLAIIVLCCISVFALNISVRYVDDFWG
jgi:hypothetical protein